MGWIGNIEYKDFQAGSDGKFDWITGCAGITPVDGFFIASHAAVSMLIRNAHGLDYHANMANDEYFGLKMLFKLRNNLKGNDKNKGEARPMR